MLRKSLITTLFIALLVACSTNDSDKYNVQSSRDLTFDELIASQDSFVGMKVTVEANVHHFGMYEGRRIFLTGDDDTIITHQLRCDATPSMGGFFDDSIIGRRVKVTGLLQERRIDDNYITYLTQMYNARDEQRSSDHYSSGISSPYYLVELATDNTMISGYRASNNPDSVFASLLEGYRERIIYNRENLGKNYIPVYYIDVVNIEYAD